MRGHSQSTTDPDGQLRVLLVTSRETRRWVIPKGWAAGELTLAEAAAREALGLAWAVAGIGVLTFVSGTVVAVAMREQKVA